MSQKNLIQLNINGVTVYVAQFDESVKVEAVEPAIRNQLVEGCADELTKRQRYCVWRLLDYALKQHCGRGVGELNFTVESNGKWQCDGGVNFSLSHSGNAVAVAICKRNVGLDIEALDYARFNNRLAERILTASERKLWQSLPSEQKAQMLAQIWTKKESLFKLCGGATFVPKDIDTIQNATATNSVTVTLGDVSLVVTVAV